MKKPKTIAEIPTPALLVEEKILQNNITNAAILAKQHQKKLRPHIKTHKCPHIAALQKNAGADGFTTATLEEAEMLIKAGFNDIFVAYPIIEETKANKFATMAKSAKISCAVDSIEHAKWLGNFGMLKKQVFRVRIEIDCGHHRCGLPPGNDVVQLVKFINTHQFLKFEGVFTHAGHAYAANSIESLQTIAREEASAVTMAAEMIKNIGINCETVSTGSTPTFSYGVTMPGVTELRPGNYVFNDSIQVSLGVAKLSQCALTVLTTVIGIYSDRFVIDAGSKTIGLDKGAHSVDKLSHFGIIVTNNEGWIFRRVSEEHGIVEINYPNYKPALGDKIRFIPNHACAAVNLFSQIWIVNGEKVTACWPISARR